MEQYQPNSHKSKEKKKVEKVVKGKVKIRKKTELRKLADIFMPEDVSELKAHFIQDVLVPKIKGVLADIARTAIDMALYGENASYRRDSSAPKISYSNYSSNRNYTKQNNRNDFKFDEIIIASRGEAEEILMAMDGMLETYGSVSISDYYDLIGITVPYTGNKYGWKNLANADVVRVRDGYTIKLPKALLLD